MIPRVATARAVMEGTSASRKRASLRGFVLSRLFRTPGERKDIRNQISYFCVYGGNSNLS